MPNLRAPETDNTPEQVTEANVNAIMEYRLRSPDDPLNRAYGHVIRGTGWKHNVSVYDDSARPLLQSNQKFPRMTHEYESVNVPGMYFAGTFSHGKDLKRGVTSVIKGFRYTARALTRILAQKYHGEDDFNTQEFCLPSQQVTKYRSSTKFDFNDVEYTASPN